MYQKSNNEFFGRKSQSVTEREVQNQGEGLGVWVCIVLPPVRLIASLREGMKSKENQGVHLPSG